MSIVQETLSIIGLCGALELTAADSQKVPRVSILAYSGGSMQPGGWSPVVIDLQGLELAVTVPLLADHDSSLGGIVGHGTPRVDKGRLLIEGSILPGSDPADRIVKLARAGVALQASVGVEPVDVERVREGESITVNGRTIKATSKGLAIVRRGRLRETSIVAIGADSRTSVSIAAKSQGTNGMSTEITENPPAVDPAVQAERDRVSAIMAVCKDYPTILASALSEGWSIDETKRAALAELRASRPTGGPAILHFKGESDPVVLQAAVMQAAVLIHMGREKIAEKSLGAEAAQRARDLRSNSMVDLCRAALQLEGKSVPSGRDSMIRAGLTTISLPQAMSGAANQILLEAYTEAPSAWRSFAAIRSVDDFREHTSIRPSMTGGLERIAPNGEFRHAGLAESSFGYKIDTFGKMISIDRKNIINDDLGYFDQSAAAMGKMAARSLNDLVFEVLLANAGTFFGAGNLNYAEGAGTALSVTSLGAGIATMMAQRDAENRDLDIRPRVLLVPPELRQTAIELLESEFIERAANLPTGNAMKGSVTLQVEPRLSNSGRFTGTSTKAWYLFSSPQDAALIVAFLDGQQSPVVEFFGFDSNPTTLTATWRVYHDYGAKLGDPKGAYKAKGEA